MSDRESPPVWDIKGTALGRKFEEHLSHRNQRICYDCRRITGDYILEKRRVGGGDGKIYPKDFLDVAVCRDRVGCWKRREQRWR